MDAERIPAARLRAFISSVLVALDVLPDHAHTTAERMVEADLRGRTGHGLIRLRPYCTRILAGGYNLRPAVTVRSDTPFSALVDGDNGFGQVVVTRAVELAVEKASASGLGWVATVRSNHAGAAGVYTALALKAGLGAMYFAVANTNGMPPWGGRERLLGTNPLAVAFPGGTQPPFELDIATTVASHGTIEVKARAGEPLPQGWVVDLEGRPITDPARAEEGFLLPIGGYKGAGLNFMIGAFAGVMTGAAFGRDVVEFRHDHVTPTNTGQSILVFRPDLFISRSEYEERMDHILADFRSSESMTDQPVRLPGDHARATAATNLEAGVPVARTLLDQLGDLAHSVGVAPLDAGGTQEPT